MTLNISVIYGSVRSARQGIKAAKFIVKKLGARGHNITLIDPIEYKLPLLDKMHKEYEAGTAPKEMDAISKILKASDGFIIVSAEYNHSMPPALKNLLDHFQSEYYFKPSGIVTYSAGPFGGVRAVSGLRDVLGELGTPSISSTFLISAVQNSFDEEGNALDENYDRRIKKFLDEFEWYVRALKEERKKGVPY